MAGRFSPGRTVWTGFIMHACKRSEIHYMTVIKSSWLALLLFPAICSAQSSGIRIEHITGNIRQNMVTISTGINYVLSNETRKALEQGVELEFDVTFRVKRELRWFPDPVVTEKILAFRVEHQPLSGQYLVTELNNGKRHQFRTLASALEFIGSINEFPLVHTNMLSRQERYFAQIRAELNIQSLPPPLRPLAYLSSQWKLSSPWQNLEIML